MIVTLFHIKIIPTDFDYHRDIVIDFKFIEENELADSYYFLDAGNIETNELNEILSNVLNNWLIFLKKDVLPKKSYYKIDLSDEYTGAFCLENRSESFHLSYGFVRGHLPLNHDIEINLSNREFETLYTVDNSIHTLSNFICSIETSIQLLKQ